MAIPEGEQCGTCARQNKGASYFLCSPDKCENGWDEFHGGLLVKRRWNRAWPQVQKATGPPGNEFSGNCYGDIYPCGTVILPPIGRSPIASGPIASAAIPAPPNCRPIWFSQVNAVEFQGLAEVWYKDNCSGLLPCDGSGCDPQELPPPLPGIGLHNTSGDPLCAVYDDPDGHLCTCSMGDFPVCKGEKVWVAMDLNLDGSGRPYRTFPGRNCNLAAHVGDDVPRLKDYDLTLDPATWMHSCPCETWTGETPCAI